MRSCVLTPSWDARRPTRKLLRPECGDHSQRLQWVIRPTQRRSSSTSSRSSRSRRSPLYVAPPQYPGRRGRRTVCQRAVPTLVSLASHTPPRGSASPATWPVRVRRGRSTRRRCSRPEPPGPAGAGNRAQPEEPDRVPHLLRARPRPHPCTRSRSGAWPASARCSSLPTTTTSAPGSPTPSRWPRSRSASPARLGLNVALTAAAATRPRLRPRPGRPRSEDALSPFVAGRLPPRRVRRRRRPRAAQPVRRDARRASATTPGTARRRRRPRARSWPGPTASPTCCHDFEDAVAAGIVGAGDLPDAVARRRRAPTAARSSHGFITAMVDTIADTGRVGLRTRRGRRARPRSAPSTTSASTCGPRLDAQADRVIELLQSLTSWFVDHPDETGDGRSSPGRPRRCAAAVRYVSGMTDRFAFQHAVERLGWDPSALPRGA